MSLLAGAIIKDRPAEVAAAKSSSSFPLTQSVFVFLEVKAQIRQKSPNVQGVILLFLVDQEVSFYSKVKLSLWSERSFLEKLVASLWRWQKFKLKSLNGGGSTPIFQRQQICVLAPHYSPLSQVVCFHLGVFNSIHQSCWVTTTKTCMKLRITTKIGNYRRSVGLPYQAGSDLPSWPEMSQVLRKPKSSSSLCLRTTIESFLIPAKTALKKPSHIHNKREENALTFLEKVGFKGVEIPASFPGKLSHKKPFLSHKQI